MSSQNNNTSNNQFFVSGVKKYKDASFSPLPQKQRSQFILNRESSPIRSPGSANRQTSQTNSSLQINYNRTRSPIKRQASPISQVQAAGLSRSSNKTNLSTSFLKIPSSHMRIKSEISSEDKQYFYQNEEIKSQKQQQQFQDVTIIRKSPRTGRDSSPNSANRKNTVAGFSALKAAQYTPTISQGDTSNGSNSNNTNNSNNVSVYTMVLKDEMQNNKHYFMPSRTPTKQNLIQPQLQQKHSSSSSLNSQNIQQYLNPDIQDDAANNNNTNNGSNKSQQNQQQLDSFQNYSNKYPYQGDSSSSREKSRTLSKQLSCAHSTNNNTSNTQASIGSRCGNCADIEKELEMLRQIMKQCSKCSQNIILNNSRPNSGTSQIFDIPSNSQLDQQALLLQQQQQQQQQLQQQWLLQQQQFQQQIVQEKGMNMRLQEQLQLLRRQLDQVTIERDQLHHSQDTQTNDLLDKCSKQESIIKALQLSHSRLEKKLNNFEQLKQQLQESIDVLREVKENGGYQGNNTSSSSNTGNQRRIEDNEMIAETNFLRDYLCDQQKQFAASNQRMNRIANSSNIVVQSSNNSNMSVAELTNQQLSAVQQKDSSTEQYQALPSALKALQVAQISKVNSRALINQF